jgi:hypothetical protein
MYNLNLTKCCQVPFHGLTSGFSPLGKCESLLPSILGVSRFITFCLSEKLEMASYNFFNFHFCAYKVIVYQVQKHRSYNWKGLFQFLWNEKN